MGAPFDLARQKTSEFTSDVWDSHWACHGLDRYGTPDLRFPVDFVWVLKQGLSR